IDLDDEHVLVPVDDELDVVEPDYAYPEAEAAGVVKDRGLHALGEAHGRIDADAVAGVDARALHVLHYAGDKDVHAVAHRVHLALPAGNVAVHEHGLLFVYPDGLAEIAAEGGLVRDYLHCP